MTSRALTWRVRKAEDGLVVADGKHGHVTHIQRRRVLIPNDTGATFQYLNDISCPANVEILGDVTVHDCDWLNLGYLYMYMYIKTK